MNSRILPGEAITARTTARAIEDSVGTQAFMEGLSPFQRARFEEIAHHMVYLGFEDGVDRIDMEKLKELHQTMNNHEGRAYMRGFIDALFLIEEAQGEF
jgi:hypothetical protein